MTILGYIQGAKKAVANATYEQRRQMQEKLQKLSSRIPILGYSSTKPFDMDKVKGALRVLYSRRHKRITVEVGATPFEVAIAAHAGGGSWGASSVPTLRSFVYNLGVLNPVSLLPDTEWLEGVFPDELEGSIDIEDYYSKLLFGKPKSDLNRLQKNAVERMTEDEDPWDIWSEVSEQWINVPNILHGWRTLEEGIQQNLIEKPTNFDEMKKVADALRTLRDYCFMAVQTGRDHFIVCRAPSVLTLDENGFGHNETGPCMKFDEYEMYAWHGRQVPKEWILNKESINPKDILGNRNTELRAVGAQIIGWPKMLEVLKPTVIHDSKNPDIGSLIEIKLPGVSTPARFLKAECPRNGTIVEGVPRNISTALEAQAWRIGVPVSQYQHPPRRT